MGNPNPFHYITDKSHQAAFPGFLPLVWFAPSSPALPLTPQAQGSLASFVLWDALVSGGGSGGGVW